MSARVGGGGEGAFGMEFCYFKEIFSSRFASKQLHELTLTDTLPTRPRRLKALSFIVINCELFHKFEILYMNSVLSLY